MENLERLTKERREQWRQATALRAKASEVRSSRIASMKAAASGHATFRTVVSRPAAELEARAAALHASRQEEVFAICIGNLGCQDTATKAA